jgi:phosphoribosylanthranilate isomerase
MLVTTTGTCRAWVPTEAGDTCKYAATHDWTISRRIVELSLVPVILAGGLGPDNVADAIRKVGPAGVDSKSKTDREGSHAKDLERVRRFHEAARCLA